ncbi:MAG: ATP-dependent Clp protease proteolytic subunit [Micromonosporaceae bacterium]
MAERLFAQRLVMLHGPITSDAASGIVAQLLALDGTSTEPVRLHLSGPDGELDAVFALVDAVELMRAPVHAVVTGELGGAALGVLAAARERAAYRHARFRLAEPRVADVTGTADQIVGQASRHLQLLEELIVRLAEMTGRPRSRVETDLSDGRLLSATDALEYGLIQQIVGGDGSKPGR